LGSRHELPAGNAVQGQVQGQQNQQRQLNARAPAFQPARGVQRNIPRFGGASSNFRPNDSDRSLFMTRNIMSYFETNTKSIPKMAYNLREHFYLLNLPDMRSTAQMKKDHTLHELSVLTGLSYELPNTAFPFLNPTTVNMLAANTQFPSLDFPPSVYDYFNKMSQNALKVHNPLEAVDRPPSAMLQYLNAFLCVYQKLYLVLESMRNTMQMTRTFYHDFHLLTNGHLFDPFTMDPSQGARNEFKAHMPMNVIFMNQFFEFRSMNMIFENFKFHFEMYYKAYMKSVHSDQPAPPGLVSVKLDPSQPSTSSTVPMDTNDMSPCSPQVNISAMSISDDESEDSDSRASKLKYSSVVAGIQQEKALSKRAKRKLLKANKTVTLQELQKKQLKLEAQIKEQIQEQRAQIDADAILAKTLAEEY
jgi:hypothetical protein